MNADKRLEEGKFKEEQLIWGLEMNFGFHTIRLPNPKCQEGKYF